jgi:hypothetical protein
MKAAPLAALASLVAWATLAAPARAADDNVRACIAASTDGQTLRQQGKLLAAREQMIACARDACPPIVRSHCARWLSEVDAAIPSVVVRAEDAAGQDVIGARLAIDGRAQKLDGKPVRLDPGPHTVTIVNDRGARKDERVLLAEGESSRVVTLHLPSAGDASLAPAPPAATTSRARYVPAGAWILGGIGVVGLGAATYFGLTANGDLNTLKSTCSPHCSDAATQPGRTDGVLFGVFAAGGAAAVASAIVWAVAFPSYASATTGAHVEVRPVVGGAVTAFTFAY